MLTRAVVRAVVRILAQDQAKIKVLTRAVISSKAWGFLPNSLVVERFIPLQPCDESLSSERLTTTVLPHALLHDMAVCFLNHHPFFLEVRD